MTTKSQILFGSALHPVNIPELSRLTGISVPTLYNYKRDPDKIPLGKLVLIGRVRRLSDEDCRRLMK